MLEHLLGFATELTKITTQANSHVTSTGILFRTKDLPWGWAGIEPTPQPWLDLRGPHGSKLFVSAETEGVLNESRRAQETLMGTHFTEIILNGRLGFTSGRQDGQQYIKWCAVPSKHPGSFITFLYQTWQNRETAETEFEFLKNCIEIVEMLPGR